MLTLLLATQHCTGPSLDMRLDQGLWGGVAKLSVFSTQNESNVMPNGAQ